jgi:hypothetical protein
MTATTETLLTELYRKENNALYILIALEDIQPGRQLALGSEDIRNLIDNGLRSFLEAKDRFRSLICTSPIIREQVNQKIENRLQIAAGLVDLLLSHYQIITCCSIAVLIVKEGIDTFCASE